MKNSSDRLFVPTLAADADDGCNFVFPAHEIDRVLDVMRLRKRRHLSAEHKAKLHAAGIAAGSAALEKYRSSQVANSELERDVVGQADIEAA